MGLHDEKKILIKQLPDNYSRMKLAKLLSDTRETKDQPFKGQESIFQNTSTEPTNYPMKNYMYIFLYVGIIVSIPSIYIWVREWLKGSNKGGSPRSIDTSTSLFNTPSIQNMLGVTNTIDTPVTNIKTRFSDVLVGITT